MNQNNKNRYYNKYLYPLNKSYLSVTGKKSVL